MLKQFEDRRTVDTGSELTVVLILHHGKIVADGSGEGMGTERSNYPLDLYSWNSLEVLFTRRRVERG